MAKKPATTAKINLFKGRGESFFDKFLAWAITFGRIIIMLTEIIALSAFAFRFHLDDTLTSLHTQIKQDNAFVLFYKDEEKDFRNLQSRLAQEKTLLATAQGTVQTLQDISTVSVEGTTVKNISLANGTMHLDAQATSPVALANLIQTYKDNPSVAAISVDKIENKITLGVIVTSITLKLKGGTNAKQ